MFPGKNISPSGDEERQREINKLPEEVEIVLEDDSSVTIPFRATIQAQDDTWREFRDSPFGKLILGDDPDYS